MQSHAPLYGSLEKANKSKIDKNSVNFQKSLFDAMLRDDHASLKNLIKKAEALGNFEEQQVLMAKSETGYNLIQTAAKISSPEIFKILLTNSILQSQIHTSVPNPFWIAAANNNLQTLGFLASPQTLVFLTRQRININEDHGEGTPLYIAAKNGHIQSVKAILLYFKTHGIKFQINDAVHDGKSLLQIAKENNHQALINSLEVLGALDNSKEEVVNIKNKVEENISSTTSIYPRIFVKDVPKVPMPKPEKIFKPVPVPISAETLAKQEQDKDVIDFVNALQQLFYDNLLKWQEKTGFGPKFFRVGGDKIVNPKQDIKSKPLRVPTGIATMIGIFENYKHHELNGEIAYYILKLCCQTASDRVRAGSTIPLYTDILLQLVNFKYDEKGKATHFSIRHERLRDNIPKLQNYFAPKNDTKKEAKKTSISGPMKN